MGIAHIALRIRSFSNDDGEGDGDDDGDEDVKKTIGLLSPLSRFMEDVNKRKFLLSLSNLECGPQVVNSKKIRLHLILLANGNKRDKVGKNANSFLK